MRVIYSNYSTAEQATLKIRTVIVEIMLQKRSIEILNGQDSNSI